METERLCERILQEWEKGNVCVATSDGIMIQPLEWFVRQPLDGILYDINRDEATIRTFLDNPKWVNDFALTKMLRYYYERCKEYEEKESRG